MTRKERLESLQKFLATEELSPTRSQRYIDDLKASIARLEENEDFGIINGAIEQEKPKSAWL